MTARRKRIVASVVTALVVLVAFAGVLPRVADLGKVWRLVGDLPAPVVLGIVALALANLATYPLLSMASLPGLTFGQAFVVTQASTAVANTVPAGSGVGVGVTYAMYGGYHFDSGAIALSVTSTGLANAVVKFLMPAVAALVLVVSGDAPPWAWNAARVGTLLLAVTGVLLWAAVRGRRFALAIVHGVARLVARVRHRDRAAAARAAEKWLATLVEDASSSLRARGPWVAVAAVVSHVALYALFAACLAATGAGIGLALSFAVFGVVRLGLTVPVTPGGVGVAEAGYAAALVGAGAAADPAVAAVLLFRAATYLLPIPIGLACWLLWRRAKGA